MLICNAIKNGTRRVETKVNQVTRNEISPVRGVTGINFWWNRAQEKCGLERNAAQFYGNSAYPLYYTFSDARTLKRSRRPRR